MPSGESPTRARSPAKSVALVVVSVTLVISLTLLAYAVVPLRQETRSGVDWHPIELNAANGYQEPLLPEEGCSPQGAIGPSYIAVTWVSNTTLKGEQQLTVWTPPLGPGGETQWLYVATNASFGGFGFPSNATFHGFGVCTLDLLLAQFGPPATITGAVTITYNYTASVPLL